MLYIGLGAPSETRADVWAFGLFVTNTLILTLPLADEFLFPPVGLKRDLSVLVACFPGDLSKCKYAMFRP